MRLTFLCHAATRSMREGGFPSPDEAIDAGGEAKAERHRSADAKLDLLASPALAARQTAAIFDADVTIDDALRDIDHGEWVGQSFAAVHAASPDVLTAWLADPASAAPGGETFAAVRSRMAQWLETHSQCDKPILAVTHATVIRAALAAALDMPAPAVMRIDIAPLATVELSYNRIWRLQAIRPA